MRFLSALLASAAVAVAQGSPLTTTFAGGNGQNGNMFELAAPAGGPGVTIRYFDINTNATAASDFEVYTLAGSYTGQQNNSAAWTLVGAATGVPVNGGGVASLLPVCVETYIAPGTIQSFYVTHSDGGILQYTNGTATGSLSTSRCCSSRSHMPVPASWWCWPAISRARSGSKRPPWSVLSSIRMRAVSFSRSRSRR